MANHSKSKRPTDHRMKQNNCLTFILFVCTGNRFRSPLAEAYFKKMLTTIGAAQTWRVESAGTWVSQSLPPTPEAIEEAEKRNLDITAHLSRSINETLLSQADLILVMESGQKEALTNEFPEIKRKIYLLTEICGGLPYNLPDPYVTHDPPAQIAREIEELIENKFNCIYQYFVQKTVNVNKT